MPFIFLSCLITLTRILICTAWSWQSGSSGKSACLGSWALVVHACNPSYSGGKDQEIKVRSQPGQAVLETLSQMTLHKNRVGGMTQGEFPEFKPQYHKKKRVPA
jgi:hypothetical protein